MSPATVNDSLILRTVQSRSDRKKFIDLPWKIYADDPRWAPPLKPSVAKLLDTKKHPFWKFAEGELFLAMRDNEAVGRIAAIIDPNSNAYHQEKIGVWGFFECVDDQDVAQALFSAADNWLQERGMKGARGPLSPSSNYEIGTLIKGFDRDHALMMPYNPDYYSRLINRAGYRKEKDLLSYRVTRSFTLPDWVKTLSEKLMADNNISIRCPKKWTRENVRMMCSIYYDCWAENWGFVPMTEAEEDEMAKELLFLIEPEFAFFLHHGREPVGIGLMLPDFNPLLKRFNGKLGLSTLIKKYLYMSEVTGLRGMLFGIKREHRHMGLHMVALNHVMSILQTKKQYTYAEMGWTLEDNDGINSLFQENDLFPDKRYRVYRKNFKK